MARQRAHSKLLTFPAGQNPAGGRVDTLRLQGQGRRSDLDLLMDYGEWQATAPGVLFEREGQPWEQVQGIFLPRRLCFKGVQIMEGEEFCDYYAGLPPDHPARALSSALAWRNPEGQDYYLFGLRAENWPSLLFIAHNCMAQERTGVPQAITLTRDWSPSPLSPARLVPNPKRLRQQYGGDPVAVRLGGRLYRRRLFTGGVDIQGAQRPDVHVVLNVGEQSGRWAAAAPTPPADRWENKGEGSAGMSMAEIAAEARWVIERLQAGRRVLVHCAAGMNRSATICCAVLILLEGLSAEAALERVRQYHPWARPDPHHWLALRWLVQTVL